MTALPGLTIRLSLFAGFAALVGCGGGTKSDPLPGTPISGKITIDGKPPGTYCSVQFVSVANPSDTGSGGVDPSGMYGSRVPPGRCKVALTFGSGGGSGGKAGGAFPKGNEGGNKASGPPKMAGSVELPAKFQKPETSGIEVDVVAGKPLDIDFK